MQVSENEIFQITRKACLASHMFEDYSEDIARAITLMHKHSLDGCKELEIMLSSKENEKIPLPTAHNSKLIVKRLNPMKNLIPIVDWLLSQKNRKVLVSDKIDFPLIINALLARTTVIYGGHFCIKVKNKERVLRISQEPDYRIKLSNFSRGVEISWSEDEWIDNNQKPTTKKFDVTPIIWEKLLNRAIKTYVPASEQSRLSGAGAGLLDND